MTLNYLDLSDYGTLVEKLSISHSHNENDKNCVSELEYHNYEKGISVKCNDDKNGIGTVNVKMKSSEFNSKTNPTIFRKDLYEIISNSPVEEYTIHNSNDVCGDMFNVSSILDGNEFKLSIDKDNKAFLSDYKCEIHNKDDKLSEIIKIADNKVLYYDCNLKQADYIIDQGRTARFKDFYITEKPFLKSIIFYKPKTIEIIDSVTEQVLQTYNQSMDISGIVKGVVDVNNKKSMYKNEKSLTQETRYISFIRPLLFDPFNFTNSMSNMWMVETGIQSRKIDEKIYTRLLYRVPEYRNDELIYLINDSKKSGRNILDIYI